MRKMNVITEIIEITIGISNSSIRGTINQMVTLVKMNIINKPKPLTIDQKFKR